jgi:hypothetical protein
VESSKYQSCVINIRAKIDEVENKWTIQRAKKNRDDSLEFK